MSVYSSIDIYPDFFDEEFDCEEQFCEFCTFDCEGPGACRGDGHE